jgi:hypothetical protein
VSSGTAGGSSGSEQSCPPNEFATGVDAQGKLVCASLDVLVQAAFHASCSLYLGWRDDCNGCALAPTKWGRVSATVCQNGAGADNTCTTPTLGASTVELFGLNTDGDVDGNDKFYVGFHCGTGDNTTGPGPCAPGELAVDVHGQSVACGAASGAVLAFIRSSCFVHLGWRDDCNGCTTAPSKWGRANDAKCDNGAGADNTCTMATLGGETVRLFGLNTDGDVDGNDKFHLGFSCEATAGQGGPAPGPCPLGQFVVGTHADGSVECAAPTSATAGYVRDHCTAYLGWNDNCDGCGSPPEKWGRVRENFCQNGAGADNTCTSTALGASTVELFGLNTDGDVDGNDTFYVGLRCE